MHGWVRNRTMQGYHEIARDTSVQSMLVTEETHSTWDHLRLQELPRCKRICCNCREELTSPGDVLCRHLDRARFTLQAVSRVLLST